MATVKGLNARLLGGLVALALSACASQPHDNDAEDVYSRLYHGSAVTGHGTDGKVATPDEAYERAETAARDGNLDRALFEYIRGLRLEEEPVAEPLYRIGAIHHERGQGGLAEMAFRWALDVDPDHAQAGTSLGLLLLEQREYEDAEALLERVIETGEPSWRAYNGLGVLADLREDFALAERRFHAALEHSPTNAQVLNNLGYSRYLAGDWEGAGKALYRALRNDPDYELAWRNLGLVYARQGQYEDAVEALARSNSQAEAYNDVGYVSMLLGNYADAARLFREALHLAPAFYQTASENARRTERLIRRHGNSGIGEE